MTDHKTKQKAIEAAADIFGDYYITTSLLWLLSTQIQFFCGYSLLLLRGNLIYF